MDQCRIVDGVLYKGDLLWVPEDLRTDLLKEIYNQPASGHPGIERTTGLLRRHFYWPGHVATIRRYIRNCHHCQRSKAPRDSTNGLIQPLPVPQARW